MRLSKTIFRALEYAAHAHEGQYRKSDGKIPYFSHCAAVGMILHDAGFSDDVVCAGILHDILEDTAVTEGELRREFNTAIARLVVWVTEPPKSVRWEERKATYREQLSRAPAEARAISTADKLHNIQSILASLENGEPIFAKMSRGPAAQIEQWEGLLTTLKEGWNAPLLEDLENLIAFAKEKLLRDDPL